ncbi:Trimeric LpxA-like [Phytophthora cactorum]|nr:Trimeric LpxA-like [Phytophthora cactorum]
MASGGGQSPSALAAGLLLCCMATSALTTLMIHLYLHSPASPSKSAPEKSIPALPVNGSTGNKKILDLQALEDTALKEFDHARLFDGCSNVLAVLDAIHPYLEKFFANNAWMSASTAENTQTTTLQSSTKLDSDGRGLAEEESDSEDSDGPRPNMRGRSSSYPRIKTRWSLPEWLDPNETAEIVIYPGTPFNRERRVDETRIVWMVKIGGITGRGGGNGEEEADSAARRTWSIHIGKHVRIESNVFIKGPAIIGARSTLRSGTCIRGDVIVGRNVVLRGEVKNSVILDDAELCHPGYCGDSICGFMSHFGNQVTTANLSLFPGSNLTIDVDGVRYDTGRKKMGVILGDGSQLGCSSVTDPCTLIQQNTVVYPLTRLRKGIYGSSLLIKNKPMEKGVLEIVPLRPTDNMK